MAKTVTKKYSKQALVTGVGSMFLQFMTKEDTPTTAPEYAETVFETPSLDKISSSLEIIEKLVYLSGKLHSQIKRVKFVKVTIDAGYFPESFAEEASGMVKVGDSWIMPEIPMPKIFRLGLPLEDENGDEKILNYPKCKLTPINVNGETSREDVSEQIQQYELTAMIPDFKGAVSEEANAMKVAGPYLLVYLNTDELKAKYDREKLLLNGWYDAATLKACEKSTVVTPAKPSGGA